jgi:uncharacterized membrane protein
MGDFMLRLWNTFLKGLAVVLPVAATIYVVYWLGSTAESKLGSVLKLVLPAHWYYPGMGLVVGFLFTLVVGLMIKAYVVRQLIRLGEASLARIPLVKTVYGALKDFTRFLPAGGERRDLKRVVTWKVGNARLIGFVTTEEVSARLIPERSAEFVAVYFPMSYALGGYTLYVPRIELEESLLSAEEAMRLAILGGVSSASPSR